MNLTPIVQQIYACFGQGGIPGILEKIADKAEWFHAGDSAVIPYAGTFKGKDGVMRFFQTLNANTAFTGVEIFHLRAYNNRVLFEGKADCIARPTGKAFHMLPAYVLIFDAKGHITNCVIEGDMSEAEAAFQG